MSTTPVSNLAELRDMLHGRRVVALTGAGCSTESGIPDYRGPSSIQRARKPIQFQEFMRSEAARVRYWSRSAIGWTRIALAQPNAGHVAFAEMEAAGALQGIITQNVDGLHHAAGSQRVVELHGTLARVRCLSCQTTTSRQEFQERLLQLNQGWSTATPDFAPDGDAEVDASLLADFKVPACDCGGVMKPDVVFFGENVPKDTVQQAWELFEDGDVLLVAGSSLTVYSGRRFIYRALEQSKAICVVNVGPTRADDVAAIKVEGTVGEILPQLRKSLAA